MTLQMLPSRQLDPIPSPLRLVDKISGALISEWGEQTAKYSFWWDWYDGIILNAPNPRKKDKKLFPLGIHTITQIVDRHAIGLFGQHQEDTSSLVDFTCRRDDGSTDDLCLKTARIINNIWRESNGADIMMDNAVTSQVLGGSVYRPVWQPWNKGLSTGFRINKIIPDYFLPVWSDDDPWEHPEFFIMQYISGDEARARYGVDNKNMPYVLYVEHWNKDIYDIEIADQKPSGEGWGGSNPFGIIPAVYIPHVTRAAGRYGKSHVPSLVGLVTELNHRMLDRGDGVKAANFNRLFGRNLPSSGLKVEKYNETEMVINIGSQQMGSNAQPEVFYLTPSSVQGAQLSRDFVTDLKEMIAADSSTPAIMYGSIVERQSADARDLEFYPYLEHLKAERALTSIGFQKINHNLLHMMLVKGVGGVTKEMLTLELVTRWGYPIPQQREMKVQEVVQRRTTEPPTMSLETAVQSLAQDENVQEEVQRIEAEMQECQKQIEATEQRQQKMTMETQRQNMQMKLQASAKQHIDRTKTASSRQAKK